MTYREISKDKKSKPIFDDNILIKQIINNQISFLFLNYVFKVL